MWRRSGGDGQLDAATDTELLGIIASSASSGSIPAARKESCTAWKAVNGVMTRTNPSSSITSSAPASIAASITLSGSWREASTRICPFGSNIQETEPSLPRFPPCFDRMWRITATVRFSLSVRHSMKSATPPTGLYSPVGGGGFGGFRMAFTYTPDAADAGQSYEFEFVTGNGTAAVASTSITVTVD